MDQTNTFTPPDDDDTQRLLIFLLLLIVFLSIIGVISCIYQFKRLQQVRKRHTIATSQLQLPNQRNSLREVKSMARQSRGVMQQHLANEVDELRAFQKEVSGQLGVLKGALLELSNRQQSAAAAAGGGNSGNSYEISSLTKKER